MYDEEKIKDILCLPSPLEKVEFLPWTSFGKEIYFKRDDLIHPAISGNKWRKLEGHLLQFFKNRHKGILTFGGAYSNHIIAVAAACQILKIPSVGIVRGEIDIHNPAMKFARECGMQLISISRTLYKEKNIDDVLMSLPDLQEYLIVPEGGSGEEGMYGLANLSEELPEDADLIVTACGTGTTLAGLINVKIRKYYGVGISVLKGRDTLTPYVQSLSGYEDFEIISGYHFGGYGRKTDELISFAKSFTHSTKIPLDFVYTAKMVYAFDDLLRKGYFDSYQKIILLHTGGLMNAPIE